jgi:hypothetical protein
LHPVEDELVNEADDHWEGRSRGLDYEPCAHDCDELCDDDGCNHQHCFACGGCNCAGYCDDYQTYNLRPSETGGAPAADVDEPAAPLELRQG